MSARDHAVMFVVDVSALDRCVVACAGDDEDEARRNGHVATTSARAIVASCIRGCVNAKTQLRTPSQRDHCFGLTLFGARDTSNDVAAAALDDDGEGDEYAGIVTERQLRPPESETGLEYERDILETAAAAEGAADVPEALAVACDSLIRKYSPEGVNAATKKRLAGCVKDIVLITDATGAATMQSAVDDEFVATLLDGMKSQNVRLKVGVVDACEMSRARGDAGVRVTASATFREPDFEALRQACDVLAAADAGNDSGVVGASALLLDLQIKRVRPTSGYRGFLSFGFNAGVNVALYKLNTEAVPVKLNRYSEELADRPEESHQTLVETTYRNVNDLDGEFVPPERHVKAFRYGKQHIPIDAETESRLSMRFEKSMKVIGSISMDECPLWLSVGEPSVCVPQPSTKTTGLSQERAAADATALSALARALDDAKLALLVRGAFTEGTTSIHIGALTPRLTDAGDFLLYTPLPFKEDYNEYSLPSVPASARVDADDPRLVDAREFVRANSLDGDRRATTMPWESLNPTLRAYRDLFEARALGAQASLKRRPSLALGVAEASACDFAARFGLNAAQDRSARPRLAADEDAAKAPSPLRVSASLPERPQSQPSFAVLVDVVKTEDGEEEALVSPPDLDVFDDME